MSFSSLIRPGNFSKLCNANKHCFNRVNANLFTREQGIHGNAVSRVEQSQNPGKPDIHTTYVHPTNFQKWILVWVGRYKNASEIPARVTTGQMDAANNRARIKTCNYMIVATLIGCLGMAISGKRAHQRGESIVKMNEEWHKEFNKKYEEDEQKKQELLSKP